MSVQTHIHLDTVVSDTGELSPVHKWVIKERNEIPVVIMSLRRTLTGNLRRHVLSDAGEPVLFMNYQLLIKCEDTDTETARQRLEYIYSMLGKMVYFVDIDHCDDDEDHTAHIKQMIISEIAPPEPINRILERWYVPVTLEDASR